ncbi:salicylate hydroxylase [Penicillium lagena]|uniref:salicylate hydroxylase n=1 Tax=Penicillium lagena TaxID=94218 RepID=UPI002540B178|nr:salicylate hydroxylase [Penicillium lagena]KAJ5605397.1 salicylate hydroxylase [Penicillium lagena]
MSSDATQIAIIGGGIAGLALALRLQQGGLHLTVFERRSNGHAASGSMVLTPNALRVLKNLGVYEQIFNAGHVHVGVNMINTDGLRLGRMNLGSEEINGYPAIRAYRSVIHDALLVRAMEKKIEIRFGMECTGVVKEGQDSVVVRFSNEESFEASVVVGADGIFSKMRHYVAPHATLSFSGQMVIFTFTSNDYWKHSTRSDPSCVVGSSGLFFILPTDNSRSNLLLFTTIEVPDRPKDEWQALAANKRALSGMLQSRLYADDYPEWLRELVASAPLDQYDIWPFYFLMGPLQFTSTMSHVVLVGDAAHSIPPSAGQGGAIALEDAETLAEVILTAHAEPSSESHGKLLATWENCRQERIERVTELTRQHNDLRRACTGTVSQSDKEAYISQFFRTQDLEWLYGFRVEDFCHVLRTHD